MLLVSLGLSFIGMADMKEDASGQRMMVLVLVNFILLLCHFCPTIIFFLFLFKYSSGVY